nr:CDP-diacylglycerol--glycerol-3-phosphate 3-phosphatidyltransferase [Sulfurimonas sp. MAG313]
MSNTKSTILNTPNILAFIRVLMAPIMFWIILSPEFFTDKGIHITWVYYLAALIFVMASITDFFDGYIARMLDQATLLGKILDPLADKMLTIGAFLALMMTGDANPWAIYIIIVRELFITGLRTVAVAEGIDVGASFAGKVKTVTQMIAIGFLIMHWDLLGFVPFAVDNILLWFAVVLTLYSGAEYIIGFTKAFKDK